MGRQHKDGTRCAVSDEAHARPDVDCPRERVAACGNKDDALSPCACRLVNRVLKSRRTVSIHSERVKIDGLVIVGTRRDDGCREGRGAETEGKS